jgi:hypothetical protein
LRVGVDESPVKDSSHICLLGVIHAMRQKQFEQVEEVLDEEDGTIRGIVTTGLVEIVSSRCSVRSKRS